MKDPYEILGVDRNATDKQVKAAYRSHAKKYHAGSDDGLADEEMKEIDDAYSRIMDERGSASDRDKTRSKKRLVIPLAALGVLVIAAGLTIFFVLRGPKDQVIDYRDNSMTSAQKATVQRVANEAGRPGHGRIELLSYDTKYVKNEAGDVTGLVVVGLLRNGYNTDVELQSLDLTVKSADGETEIAYAHFEGEYGVIGKRESIIWKFTFTEEFIYVTDADLSKTVNYIEYTFERK